MKQLLDLIPIIVFVVAYRLQGIYTATAVLMGATVVQMAVVYALDRRLSPMHKATLALILVFGTLTLTLHDERFIKWKPTVLYGAMALVLVLALLIWKRNLLQQMLGSQLELPQAVWQRLAWSWVGYCVFMAAINGYVAQFFTTSQWVDFKLWGYAFPLVFLVGQGIYIARYMKAPSSSSGSDSAS